MDTRSHRSAITASVSYTARYPGSAVLSPYSAAVSHRSCEYRRVLDDAADLLLLHRSVSRTAGAGPPILMTSSKNRESDSISTGGWAVPGGAAAREKPEGALGGRTNVGHYGGRHGRAVRSRIPCGIPEFRAIPGNRSLRSCEEIARSARSSMRPSPQVVHLHRRGHALACRRRSSMSALDFFTASARRGSGSRAARVSKRSSSALSAPAVLSGFDPIFLRPSPPPRQRLFHKPGSKRFSEMNLFV